MNAIKSVTRALSLKADILSAFIHSIQYTVHYTRFWWLSRLFILHIELCLTNTALSITVPNEFPEP